MKLDILAFGAHPDDVELSAAGTLLHYAARGKSIGIIDLTEGELGTRGTVESRYEEAAAAASILGIQHRHNLRLPDGFFENTHAAKLQIIEQIRLHQPQIVLANALSDRHPDHARAGHMVAEACFLAGLRKIHTSHNGTTQTAHRPKLVLHYIQDYHQAPSFVQDVTPHVAQKIEAVKAYKTQFFDPNSPEPNTPISGELFFDFLKGRMLEMGRPAGYNYAEGFVLNRWFGVQDIFELD
ncbi:MAG: bacillithiol biosynthesis deacetylase BshB1 [Flavobacteriia bacterium]|nr:bacillithiol biosynthesis deacetylase BshB1 [Flavobacteriia bacterium]